MPSASYPIVASFRDWIFPHQLLDTLWPHEPAIKGDSRCGITGDWGVAVQIVPQTEQDWYNLNKMAIGQPKPRDPVGNDSSPPPISIYSRGNSISLERTLHAPFNAGSFAIVPKLTPMGVDYVVTIFAKYAGDPEESWVIFNGGPARPFAEGSKRLLFARFAWTIFLHSNPWISDSIGDGRTILRVLFSPYTRVLRYGRESAPYKHTDEKKIGN